MGALFPGLDRAAIAHQPRAVAAVAQVHDSVAVAVVGQVHASVVASVVGNGKNARSPAGGSVVDEHEAGSPYGEALVVRAEGHGHYLAHLWIPESECLLASG